MLKRLPLFFIFIFISFILGVSFHQHKDGNLHDDCPVCIAITNNKAFLTQDTYQGFSYNSVISTVLIDKDLITPCTLTHAFSIRAPPA
jgi:hypothetical protein